MIDTTKKLGQNLTALGQNLAKWGVLHSTHCTASDDERKAEDVHETTVNIDDIQCLRAY